MYLYKITNNISGSVYIGITRGTISSRFSSHKCAAKRGNKTKLYDAMRKYGVSNFSISVLNSYNTEDQLLRAEKNTIRNFRNDEKHNVYNILDGGTSHFPIKDKEEWRKKMILGRQGLKPALGMKHTDKNKKLFSKVSRKYWDTQETYKPAEILQLSFKYAKIKFGISKTHYYRLRRNLDGEITNSI